MTSIPRDNNPAELKAFDTTCQRLGGFDDRVSFEWVDGYLTALAAGLRVPDVEEWLPAMCGDAFERAFADPADHAQASKSLRTRLSVLADQLDPEALIDRPDQLRLQPLLAEWTDEDRARLVAEGSLTEEGARELVDGAVWAEGFLDAMGAFSALWPEPAEDEIELYSALLEQVQVLLLPEDSDEFRLFLADFHEGAGQDGDGKPDREALITEACFAVQDLRVWNADHAPKPETRRVEKTPGRNDPCPCGSGKKFKKCHGA